MPDWFSRLRNIVWSAVVAVIAGSTSAVAALCGARLSVTTSLAALGVTLAVLSSRQ